MLVEDRAAHQGALPNHDAAQQHAVLDRGVARDPGARREHRPGRGAGHDAPGPDDRVVGDAALHELRPRLLRVRRRDRPAVVVEVEDRVNRHEVHVRVEVRADRPDVAPVTPVPVGRAGHVVVREVVDVRRAVADEPRDDVAPHVVRAGLVRRVGRDRLQQHLGAEHVVAHRSEDLVRRVRQPGRVRRLLEKGLDALACPARGDHAELRRLRARHPDARDGHAGAGRHVLVDHLLGVHAVDVVRAEHDDDLRPFVVQQIEVLEDRVAAAGVPAGPEPLLRGHRRHVVAEQRGEPPGQGDVPVEGV